MPDLLVILAVADVATSKRFYASAFGWSLRIDVPVYGEFVVPGGGRLGVYERDAYAANVGRAPTHTPRGAVGGTEVYVYVDALDETIARLDAAGAATLSPRSLRPWGDEAAYFMDPDGNVVVVARAGG